MGVYGGDDVIEIVDGHTPYAASSDGEGVDDGDINSGNPGDEGLEGRVKVDGEQQCLEMGNDGDEPGMGGGSRRSTTGKINSQRLQMLN